MGRGTASFDLNLRKVQRSLISIQRSLYSSFSTYSGGRGRSDSSYSKNSVISSLSASCIGVMPAYVASIGSAPNASSRRTISTNEFSTASCNGRIPDGAGSEWLAPYCSR
uniref:Uncharacterized protein n=1 Tax=Anopheles melas TaxID=34690 RepID=A0A182UHB5_9DIPT